MADETDPHLVLGPRFADAVALAAELHRDQSRKDSGIPYVSHLLGAASFLVQQPGCTEDEAIAALLHDALEDQPDRIDAAGIAARFGEDVARIVVDCTDADTHPKPPWRHRKVAYLAHLETVPEPSLRVSVADKLHNARAIASDRLLLGDDLWRRFNAPPVAQRWYLRSLAEVFCRRLGNDIATLLDHTVAEVTDDLPTDIDLQDNPERPPWVGADAITASLSSLDHAGEARFPGQPVPVGLTAWTSEDGRWWIEQVDAGDPHRPLTVFVAPVDGS